MFITDLIRQRHPHPSSDHEVQPDLTSAFLVVVGAVDVIAVVILIAFRAGSSVYVGIPFLLVANVCIALMLWRARVSISRLWAAAAR